MLMRGQRGRRASTGTGTGTGRGAGRTRGGGWPVRGRGQRGRGSDGGRRAVRVRRRRGTRARRRRAIVVRSGRRIGEGEFGMTQVNGRIQNGSVVQVSLQGPVVRVCALGLLVQRSWSVEEQETTYD